MEENLKRNFNLISLQHGVLNFAAISLDDRSHRAVLLLFFLISTSVCLFSFQGQNNFISLMDIHVQHVDHKRKVDTNRFVSEIH